MLHRLLVFVFSLASFCLNAQLLDHRQGEVIVQLGADVDAKAWLTSKAEFTGYRPLGRALNAYLVTYDFNLHEEANLRNRYWPDPAVVAWQRNHFVSPRARPNDTRYNDQWQLRNTGQIGGVVGADHNVEPAWDITTGGVTANGDTIVIAILDDGVDVDHEDLVGNLWRNHDEIPGNGIDDDNNGYIDDYHGWNTSGGGPGNGNVDAGEGNHGTPVAGIIGAVGNNAKGVAGTNWSVKMMIIKNNFATSEAEVLQAYSYVLEQRLRYDATDGEEGAYVVATNSSWGRNYGQVEDSPIWCSIYDQLGAAGILNAGATANLNINVEEEGDLPTNCTSPYLIGVTNLNTFDVKVVSAGYGNKSIDLGAYGEDAYTTVVGNGYGRFVGTSSATPGVAGAIALLYATPCDAFGELLRADPEAAALRVRQAILSNVRPNASLSGITVTNGRLDVAAAMNGLRAGLSTNGIASCDACLPPTAFTVTPVPGSATALTVDWRVIESVQNLTLRYRVTGTGDWTDLTEVSPPYELSGLGTCVSYDLQLTGNCGGTMVNSNLRRTSTDGCCVIPEDFTVVASPNQVFIASWTQLLAAESYRIRYRKLGDSTWLNRTSRMGSIGLAGGIEPCTDYEFEFQTNCDTLVTDFGRRLTVRSTGCGACLEKNYCTPPQLNNNREWIREVNLGNILVNSSGAEDQGYRNFGEVTAQPFVRGGEYPITITPGFSDGTSIEGFRVYVDWNQDGVFASTEVAAEMLNTIGQPARAVVTVPETAALLLTRMRVVMQFRTTPTQSCGSFNSFSEIEDYCLNIGLADLACPPPSRLNLGYDTAEDETVITWRSSAAAGGSYRVRYRLRDSQTAWVETDVDGTRLLVDNLNLCGAYEIEIASLCGGSPGEFRRFYFTDVCTNTQDNRLADAAWNVFPNPAAGQTTVSWSGNLRPTLLRLFDVNGRQLAQQSLSGGSATQLNLADLPAGVYLLRLQTADGRTGVRRVVVR